MSTIAPTVHPSRVEAHAHCLECGYDLTGIPETRCPECGFGFTRASTLWMAKSFARVKLNVYGRVLLFSLASCGLSLLSIALSPWMTAGLLALGLVPGSGFVALVTALRVGWPMLQMYFWLGGVGIVLLILGGLRWPAQILLVVPMVMLLSLPRAYPYFELSLTEKGRKRLSRSRIAAYSTLSAAVALTIVS